jgi:hypothetical protein
MIRENLVQLWSSVAGIYVPEEAISKMDSSDLDFVESMCGDCLEKAMKLKTDIANAKFKLQASYMQRGAMPKAEERKEGVPFKAHPN